MPPSATPATAPPTIPPRRAFSRKAVRSSSKLFVNEREQLVEGGLIAAHSTQADELLPKLVRGEIKLCLGLTEPESGSDASAMNSRADFSCLPSKNSR